MDKPKLYAISMTAIKVTSTGIRMMSAPGTVFARSEDEAAGAAQRYCRTKLPDCTNHDAVVSVIPVELLRQALEAYE